MSELRRAACRGAWWSTDESGAPHGPHGYFPHQWAEPVNCPGWTAMESDAVNLVDLLAEPRCHLPGTELQCHPVVEYAMLGVIIPGYREFTDPDYTIGMPLQRLMGVPVVRTVAAERGAWRLVNGRDVLAEGAVRAG